MSLVAIINQVWLTLRVLESRLPVTAPFGDAARHAHQSPPVVTWEPAGNDGFEPGGEQHTGSDKSKPRVVAMRLAGCRAHLWAAVIAPAPEDGSATETLLGQVVGALKANLKARDLILLGGAWEEKSSDVTALGRSYVLTFQVRIPLVEQGTDNTATQIGSNPGPSPASNVPTSTEMAFPDGQVVPNP